LGHMEQASVDDQVPDVNFTLDELLNANVNLDSVEGEQPDGFEVPPLDDEEGEITPNPNEPLAAENLEEDVQMEDIVETRPPIKSDREWVKVIYAGAKDHQYSGQSSGSASDAKEDVLNYKFFVEEAIVMANVPDDPISQGFVARCFLTGAILKTVVARSVQLDKKLTKDEIFLIVDGGIEGLTPGNITRALRFNELSAHKVAVAMSKKSEDFPDLNQVVQEIKRQLVVREQICPMERLDKLLMWLHMFRGSDVELSKIREKAMKSHENGISVEQEDPDLMVKSILNCNSIWQKYWARKKSEFESRRRNFATDDKRDSKRLRYSAPNSDFRLRTTEASTSRQPFVSRTPFVAKKTPFEVFDKTKLSKEPTKANPSLWIKGLNNKKKEDLKMRNACLLCEKPGHRLVDCKSKGKAFDEERFCYKPEEKKQ
jgi:hypothetical protein